MTADQEQQPVLRVKDLVSSFRQDDGSEVRAVDGVSFDVFRGRTVGLVGESGCGKSVTALSILRLLPRPAGRIAGGEILFNGRDIVSMPVADLHALRGNRISMIFQEPMTALNPVQTVGQQLAEVFALHEPGIKGGALRDACCARLNEVSIPEPARRLNEYPHQLSGGMRQRVMIAMALACKPDVLIADEPTTALDVTIQAQILDLIRELQRQTGMAVIFITHALGVVADLCDDVVVMYAGRVAESGPMRGIFESPLHPYTRGLLQSIPRLDSVRKSRLPVIDGQVPALKDLAEGCRFAARCSFAQPVCRSAQPPLVRKGLAAVACARADELPPWQPPRGPSPSASGLRNRGPASLSLGGDR